MSGPIHIFFGLSYASYLVVPRAVLQSMPEAWQQRLVDLLEEMRVAIPHEDEREGNEYDVRLRGHRGRYAADPLADYRRGPRRDVPDSPAETAE